jgi:hypothetical protein
MKTFGINIPVDTVVSAALPTPRAVISECFLLGVYNTQLFTLTTNTPDVLPGMITDIEDATNRLDVFDEDEFKIYWDTQEDEEDVNPLFPGWTGGVRIPRNLIIILEENLFRFIMPDNLGIPYGGRRLMLTGTGSGVAFSGEFPLQNYNTTLVEGSGLYKLVPGQAYDTYYDRSVSPAETVNLKIPDPSIKTGYFNA